MAHGATLQPTAGPLPLRTAGGARPLAPLPPEHRDLPRRDPHLAGVRSTPGGHSATRLTTRSLALALLTVLATILPAPLTRAGYIRDDRDPAAYVNLANDPAYASAGGFTVTSFGTEFAGSGTLVG